MFWDCCKKTYTAGVRECKVCGKPKARVTTDGKRIIVTHETPLEKEKREGRNRTAKILSKVKVDEKQMFTSFKDRMEKGK